MYVFPWLLLFCMAASQSNPPGSKFTFAYFRHTYVRALRLTTADVEARVTSSKSSGSLRWMDQSERTLCASHRRKGVQFHSLRLQIAWNISRGNSKIGYPSFSLSAATSTRGLGDLSPYRANGAVVLAAGESSLGNSEQGYARRATDKTMRILGIVVTLFHHTMLWGNES